MSDEPIPEPRWRIRLRRTLRHGGFMAGAVILALAVLLAVFAPLLAPHDPYAQDLSRRLLPPAWDAAGGWVHPLGTDHLGRDYLSRLILGSRVSLAVGFAATLIAGVTADLTGKVKAGELVNYVAQQVGGKGGGKPDLAMAGGTDAAALPKALASVAGWVGERA